jgi:histone deacetylase 1/2
VIVEINEAHEMLGHVGEKCLRETSKLFGWKLVGNLKVCTGAGHKPKFVRCDDAGENSKQLKKVCENQGVKMEFTAPHTPQHNGVVERGFVTVRQRALAMMLSAKFTDEYQGLLWAEAVHTATRLTNSTVNSVTKKSPDDVFYGETNTRRPYKLYRQFGRVGWVTIREGVKKLDARSIKCVFLGYSDDHSQDTYRMYNHETNTVVNTRDVKWSEWHGTNVPTDGLEKMFKPVTNQQDTEISVREDNEELHDDFYDEFEPREVSDNEDEDDDKQELGRKTEQSTKIDGTTKYEVTGTNTPIVKAKRAESAQSKQAKLAREMRRLDSSFNPTSTKIVKISGDTEMPGVIEDNMKKITKNTQVNFVYNASLASDPGLPTSYDEAMARPDKKEWIKAINKEYENFQSRGVWKVIKRDTVKKRTLKTRWVFRIKEDVLTGKTIYKARLVVKGYEQIPGVDFTETFAPVASDATIKTVLAVTMYNGWRAEAIDVEAAFLNADVDEDIYIEPPQGLIGVDSDTHVCKLVKAMYGIVQAPRCWSRTFAKCVTNKPGMTKSKIDPMLFMHRNKDGQIDGLLVNYVDDGIVCGTPSAVEYMKNVIKEDFNITEQGILQKHLGVEYAWKEDKYGEYWEVQMQKFRMQLLREYEKLTGMIIKSYATPGVPGKTLNKNDGEVIMEGEYRKIVGKLLWSTKKDSPDCANAVRELSAHLSCPGEEQWHAVARVIGYLSNMEDRVLKLRKPKELRVIAYVDSDWAANKVNRKSTTGYLVTIGGALISWQSKGQQTVTLSSTEAEYVAMSQCGQEIKFIAMLLNEVTGGKVTLPSILREDNTGAIFIAKNQQIGTRTKHIDIKYHHVKDMIEDEELEVIFIRSEDNFADIMTKNVKEQIHTRLSEPVQSGTMLQPLERGNGEDVKNISPSHKDCGLDCNRTSRILHCHVNQLSNKIKD